MTDESSNNKTLLLIVLVAVLAAVVSGGGTGFLIVKLEGAGVSGSPAAHKQADRHVHKPDKRRKIRFASLKSMVISLPDKSAYDGTTYLQLSFKFATTSKKAVAEFKSVKPEIRGQVLEFMLDERPTILRSHAARKAMKTNVLGLVNSILSASDAALGDSPMSQVYITRFVTQS